MPVDVEGVHREVEIMRHMPPHPNIVTLSATYEDEDVVHIIMELCEGGELFDRIVARGHYTERANHRRGGGSSSLEGRAVALGGIGNKEQMKRIWKATNPGGSATRLWFYLYGCQVNYIARTFLTRLKKYLRRRMTLHLKIRRRKMTL